MEILGREPFDVVSLSTSPVSETSFVSLGGNGTVTLWDTRLRSKNYASIKNPNAEAAVEAAEVLLADKKVVTMCGGVMQLFDLRALDVAAEYTHGCDVVQFLSGSHPQGARNTVVADEDGALHTVDVSTLNVGSSMDAHVFGAETEVPRGGFGSLSNYCCGLGVVRNGPNANASRALFSLGMDGVGGLYSSPTHQANFSLMDETSLAAGGGAQVFNPPLPNCCAFRHNQVVVGRCDGTYSIVEVDQGSVLEVLRAPGHATNCLSYVDFTQESGRLLTVSQCGEITLWDIQPFLQDEDGEADLPDVKNALSHRDSTGSSGCLINCCARVNGSAGGSYIVGDNEGHVMLCRAEE